MTDALFVLDPLPETETVVLDGPEGRHAATVRRIEVGEWIVLADGHGRFRRAEVTAVGKDALQVRCEPVQIAAEPARRIVAVQALAKGDRAELAVELLTELGVDEIVPWSAARSIVQWRGDRADKSLERWRRTAFEAGKQSRRVRFPVIADPVSTRGVAHLIGAAGVGLVLHENATVPLAGVPLGEIGDVVIVIGPEGGISDSEVAAFEQVGAVTVRLGDPVLRTSTAGAAAIAALSVRIGRWS
ncbi:MAG: rRNA ((1498)-N(3))-methyltransferase [Pseudonocardiales bacterium]|nr:rRNA ((1498)-N(3))-methyltransferase [Pseudonocardiales bacterium]